MEKIALAKVSRAEAAEVLRGAQITDPTGRASADDIAGNGDAFRLTVDGETGVFVVKHHPKIGLLWVTGAGAIATSRLLAPGQAVIEDIATKNGCTRVGFQTGRPGLVRAMKKRGFKVTGFIMEKALP